MRCTGLALASLLAASVCAAQIKDINPLFSEAEVLVSPAHPTTADPISLHIVSVGLVGNPLPPFGVSFTRTGNTFTLDSFVGPLSPRPPEIPFSTDIDLGTLPAGTYDVVVNNDSGTASQSFTVVAAPSTLALIGGRFQVSLLRGAVVAENGVASDGQPAPFMQLSDLSGYFWFFNAENAEVTVKLIDGRAVNGHFWLFAATMTDQPFVLQVVDTQCPGCASKLYANPAGKNQNFIDVKAF